MSETAPTRHRRHVRPGAVSVADLVPAADLAASYALPSGRRRPGISGHLNRVQADKMTGRGADGRYGKLQ